MRTLCLSYLFVLYFLYLIVNMHKRPTCPSPYFPLPFRFCSLLPLISLFWLKVSLQPHTSLLHPKFVHSKHWMRHSVIFFPEWNQMRGDYMEKRLKFLKRKKGKELLHLIKKSSKIGFYVTDALTETRFWWLEATMPLKGMKHISNIYSHLIVRSTCNSLLDKESWMVHFLSFQLNFYNHLCSGSSCRNSNKIKPRIHNFTQPTPIIIKDTTCNSSSMFLDIFREGTKEEKLMCRRWIRKHQEIVPAQY